MRPESLVRMACLGLGLVFASWTPAWAFDDEYRDGRVRYTEGGVTVQGGNEAGAEEASPNTLLLPGDRVWTSDRGRVEFQFGEGSLARLDSRSKLDFASHDLSRDEAIVLRLWSGGLMLKVARHDALSFVVETPAGAVLADARSIVRIDTAEGETRVSVYAGGARFEGPGEHGVELEPGERSYAERGTPPEAPRSFDRHLSDDFGDWSSERDTRDAWASEGRKYLPVEILPYASELESNGSWYYVNEVGYVWHPYVVAGWRPYLNGHWTWSAYGWTWVPDEAWGWAPSHYGRWGFSSSLGWYWIPGSVFGPAWVSWNVGGDLVGWCPLGRGDVPITLVERNHVVSRGYAVPGGAVSTWVFVRKSDIGLRYATKRVEPSAVEVQALHGAPSPRARPTRDFQRFGEGAPTRTGNLKPTIGDFVPELRQDPQPFPYFAPGRDSGEIRYYQGLNDRPPGSPSPGSPLHPTDLRSPSSHAQGTSRSEPLSDPDREVLRQVFRPVSDTENRGTSAGGGDRPPDARTSPPPPTSTPAPQAPVSHAATPPPKKDK